MLQRILVVEEHPGWSASVARALRGEGFDVETVASDVEPLRRLRVRRAGALVLHVPSGMNRRELVKWLRSAAGSATVIILPGGGVSNAHDEEPRPDQPFDADELLLRDPDRFEELFVACLRDEDLETEQG